MLSQARLRWERRLVKFDLHMYMQLPIETPRVDYVSWCITIAIVQGDVDVYHLLQNTTSNSDSFPRDQSLSI